MPKEVSMDREDSFERGFVAGWNARGEHDYPTPVAIGGSAPQPQWIADVLAERDAVRQFNERAQVEARQQQFAAQQAVASSHGQNGQAFCKNCGFPAKTCVCVPQQVNQQS